MTVARYVRRADEGRGAIAGRPGARRRARQPRSIASSASGSGFLGGRVVDFIDPQWCPVFNVADACVVIGGILLVVVACLQHAAERPDRPDRRRDQPIDEVPAALAGERLDRVVAMSPGEPGRVPPRWSAAARSSSTARRRSVEDSRLAEGAVARRSTFPSAEPIGVPGPMPTVRARRRARRRRRDRRRQARRPRRAPRRRATARHARATGCSPASPRSPASATRRGPASCTGSTRARPGCSSSPARPPPTTRSSRSSSSRTVERRYRALVWGQPEHATGAHRRADRPVAARDPTRMAVSAPRASGPHALRGADAVHRAGARCRCSSAGSRPAAPTRSACTSPRSAIRSSATTATADSAEPSPSPRPFLHAGAARLRPPGDRRARRVRVAAAGRPREPCSRSSRVEPLSARLGRRRLASGHAARRGRCGDVGQGVAVEVVAHVLADVGPDRRAARTGPRGRRRRSGGARRSRRRRSARRPRSRSRTSVISAGGRAST